MDTRRYEDVKVWEPGMLVKVGWMHLVKEPSDSAACRAALLTSWLPYPPPLAQFCSIPSSLIMFPWTPQKCLPGRYHILFISVLSMLKLNCEEAGALIYCNPNLAQCLSLIQVRPQYICGKNYWGDEKTALLVKRLQSEHTDVCSI